MTKVYGAQAVQEQLMTARHTMSVGDLVVLKALGEEGGDCEGQALVILQDVSTKTTMRT